MAGLFHSRKNRDFVGVVPPCLPLLTNHQIRVSDLWAGTGAPPLPRMKQPWGRWGIREEGEENKSKGFAAIALAERFDRFRML